MFQIFGPKAIAWVFLWNHFTEFNLPITSTVQTSDSFSMERQWRDLRLDWQNARLSVITSLFSCPLMQISKPQTMMWWDIPAYGNHLHLYKIPQKGWREQVFTKAYITAICVIIHTMRLQERRKMVSRLKDRWPVRYIPTQSPEPKTAHFLWPKLDGPPNKAHYLSIPRDKVVSCLMLMDARGGWRSLESGSNNSQVSANLLIYGA